MDSAKAVNSLRQWKMWNALLGMIKTSMANYYGSTYTFLKISLWSNISIIADSRGTLTWTTAGQ